MQARTTLFVSFSLLLASLAKGQILAYGTCGVRELSDVASCAAGISDYETCSGMQEYASCYDGGCCDEFQAILDLWSLEDCEPSCSSGEELPAECNEEAYKAEAAENRACILDSYYDNYYYEYGDEAECEWYQAELKCFSAKCQKALLPLYESYTGCDLKAACFPAKATIALSNGETKSMDQLRLGDKVHVGNGEYSEVFYFSTEETESTSKFIRISIKTTSLELTPGHYLYANDKLVQAKHVKVGDEVIMSDGSKAPVVHIDSVWGQGLYNPHTMSGDVVVDGILTSTYTGAVHPKLAHALLFPLRKMYEAGLTFGTDFNHLTKALPSWIHSMIQA